MVDDRERKYEIHVEKLRKLETELINIKNINGTKESDIDQRYNNLERDHKELKDELDRLTENISDQSKKLGRIESEYLKAESHVKDQRTYFEKL